jgi:2-polyprenyl-6-methoxyphenol hydroxylase-like FAD-dependent oxidoreductase
MARKVIIIGAGIGGLTAGVALRKIGFEVEILEAAEKLDPIGAGIWMAPNAMQVFKHLGIAGSIIAAGVPLECVSICDSKMRLIQATDLSRTRARFGFTITAIHRGTLQQILLRQFGQEHIRFGHEFQAFATDKQGVAATCTNRETVRSDILVGADGIHSRVRQELLGAKPLRYAGQTCWRGVAEFALDHTLKAQTMELWGDGVRFGFSEIGVRQVYWFAVARSPSGTSIDGAQLKVKLAAIFQTFARPVADLIEATNAGHIIQTDLYDLKPARGWAKENVCMIGDAAHPMTPNFGQGGAQAVEDAYVLANWLSREPVVPVALKKFEDQRFTKVQKIVNGSYWYGRLAHVERGSTLRNVLFRMAPATISERALNSMFQLE